MSGTIQINKNGAGLKVSTNTLIDDLLCLTPCSIKPINPALQLPTIKTVKIKVSNATGDIVLDVKANKVNISSLLHSSKIVLTAAVDDLNIILDTQLTGIIPNIEISSTATVTNMYSVSDNTVDLVIDGTVTAIESLNPANIVVNPVSTNPTSVSTLSVVTDDLALENANMRFPYETSFSSNRPTSLSDSDSFPLDTTFTTIALPSSYDSFGKTVTFTWSSDNPTIINTVSKTVTHTNGEDADYVTLTATLSLGALTLERNFFVTVLPINSNPTTTTTTLASHAITFDKNGAPAVGVMAPQIMIEGSTAPLYANGFTLTGLVFAGWGLSPGTAVPDFYDTQDFTMNTTNVTLYAIWLPPETQIGYGLAQGNVCAYNNYAFITYTDASGDIFLQRYDKTTKQLTDMGKGPKPPSPPANLAVYAISENTVFVFFTLNNVNVSIYKLEGSMWSTPVNNVNYATASENISSTSAGNTIYFGVAQGPMYNVYKFDMTTETAPVLVGDVLNLSASHHISNSICASGDNNIYVSENSESVIILGAYFLTVHHYNGSVWNTIVDESNDNIKLVAAPAIEYTVIAGNNALIGQNNMTTGPEMIEVKSTGTVTHMGSITSGSTYVFGSSSDLYKISGSSITITLEKTPLGVDGWTTVFNQDYSSEGYIEPKMTISGNDVYTTFFDDGGALWFMAKSF